MSILDEIKDFKSKPNPLIGRYVEYIKDKTIPLEERWEVFVEAPNEWKNNETWAVDFESEKLLKTGNICWHSDFYIERHEIIYVVDFVLDRLPEYLETDNYYGKDEIKTIADAFKEEVIQKNLGSFVLDW